MLGRSGALPGFGVCRRSRRGFGLGHVRVCLLRCCVHAVVEEAYPPCTKGPFLKRSCAMLSLRRSSLTLVVIALAWLAGCSQEPTFINTGSGGAGALHGSSSSGGRDTASGGSTSSGHQESCESCSAKAEAGDCVDEYTACN